MKKFISAFLLASFMTVNTAPLFAADASLIKDVSEDYWAKSSINNVVTSDIMFMDEENNFNPNKSVTRVEFIQALLKILSNDNLDVEVKNAFTDIQDTDEYFEDILRSEQLGLVFGYPDKTFRPNNEMLRCETTSVISHITKERFVDCSVLEPFADKDEITEWAKIPYAKSISYGIYVNYPDETKLEPNRTLTRAEAAVLLARLKDKLTVVKPKYVGPKEITLARERLCQYKRAPEHLVRVTNLRKVIYMGNVLTPVYETRFESKKQSVGDTVEFVFNENICTEEGSLVIPVGSKIIAEVAAINNPKSWSRAAKVCLNYKQLVLPDGAAYDLNAQTYSKDGMLTETWWQRYGKLATIVGIFTPGLNYRTRCGEKVKILLNDVVGIKDPQEIEEEPAAQETPCVQEEQKTEEVQDVQETETEVNDADVEQETQASEENDSNVNIEENK